jgi:hypothetical protein
MAKYRVIEGFYDLQDPEGRSFHLYNKGDEYPREGLEPSPERVAFLMSESTRLLKPVIEEAVEGAVEEATEAVEEAVEPAEKSKRRGKRGG